MPAAISAIVAQLLASPVVRWTLIIVGVFCFGFVRGCEWKSHRIDAATIHRVDRLPVQPRRPLFPIIRRADPPAAFEPTPDPISTPEAPQGNEPAAVVDPIIGAIRDAATKPLPKSGDTQVKQEACGHGGCSIGNCNRSSAGGGYMFQRRGLFGRMR